MQDRRMPYGSVRTGLLPPVLIFRFKERHAVKRNHPPFKDRHDAGRQLGAALQYLKESEPVVLGLPRGGIPVAYEVACALHAPLDVVLVRKISAPFQPLLGLGALAEGRHSVINRRVVEQLNVSEAYIDAEQERQREDIAGRRRRYSNDRPPIELRGRTVVVVDDGVATGGTMQAALRAVADAGPERLVFAIPVAPSAELESLYDYADDGVCLCTPERIQTVGQFYAEFEQITDDEVIHLLSAAALEQRTSINQQENIMEAISQVMTHDVTVISPQESVQRAAQMMRDWNVGSLPVCDGQRLVGMITDRDIAIRATADGRAPDQIRVEQVMTAEVLWCYEDQTVGEVLQHMGDSQVRRIPVVDRNKNLVGMVSLGDIATRHTASAEDALEKISTPSEPNRQSADELARQHQTINQPGRRV